MCGSSVYCAVGRCIVCLGGVLCGKAMHWWYGCVMCGRPVRCSRVV